MLELKGTEKQIKWAEDIRTAYLKAYSEWKNQEDNAGSDEFMRILATSVDKNYQERIEANGFKVLKKQAGYSKPRFNCKLTDKEMALYEEHQKQRKEDKEGFKKQRHIVFQKLHEKSQNACRKITQNDVEKAFQNQNAAWWIENRVR